MIPIEEKTNQKVLFEVINEEISKFNGEMVILLDGDRTLCEPDTSRIFNKMANIDLDEIKAGFIKFGYTYLGFRNMAEIYSRLNLSDYINYSKETANIINLYPGVIDFIKFSQTFADLCIVTSGIKKIW